MSTVLWIIAGWFTASVLLAVAFSLGAGIGYRRGQEDARHAQDRTIRVDEDERDFAKRPAASRAS